MPWSILELPLALPAFALVLFRVSGLMLTAPVFASRLMPMRVRGAILLALSVTMFPLVQSRVPADVAVTDLVLGGVGEIMIGLIIGLGVAILLMGAEVAGLVVSQQGGMALGEVFDPTFEEPVNVVGQVYSLVLLTVFLIAGGHRAMAAAVLDTFEVIPPLSFSMDDPFLLLLVELLGSSFALGVRLAGPVLIALLFTELVIGFLSRTMPQLNILSIGFSVRVMAALGVAALALALSRDVLLDALWDGMELIRSVFGVDPLRTRLVS